MYESFMETNAEISEKHNVDIFFFGEGVEDIDLEKRDCDNIESR